MARIPVAERRDALIAAAIRVMERDGVAETTTRKIASEAGMPLASLHYAFSSRGELIAAAARQLARELVDVLDAGVEADQDVAVTMRKVLSGYNEFLKTNPGRVLALYETQAAGVRSAELLPIANNRVTRGKEVARYFLDRAAAGAGARFSQPVEDIAAGLLSALDGISLHWITIRDDEQLRRSMELAVQWVAGLAQPLPPEEAERVRAAYAAEDLGRLPSELIEGQRTMAEIAAERGAGE